MKSFRKVLFGLSTVCMLSALSIPNMSKENNYKEYARARNSIGIRFQQDVSKEGTIEVSETFVQSGVYNDGSVTHQYIRFATAVNLGEGSGINSLEYIRNVDENEKTSAVTTVYKKIAAEDGVYYSYGDSGLTTEETENDWYFACYTIELASEEYKAKDFKLSLRVNEEETYAYTAASLNNLNGDHYVARFVNDGNLLGKQVVADNQAAKYTGKTPSRDAGDYAYKFTYAGWDKALAAVTEDVTYTATYSVTLGSYPSTKITDETLVASLTSELQTTAPTAAGNGWKAYKHWWAWDSANSKAVRKTDALYQDITHEGEKYRAVYFNSGLAKRCDQSYSESNQYQQTNGYNVKTLYFFKYQPLKWQIVDETDNYYTLISLNVIDSVCFTHDGTSGYVGGYNDLRLFTEGSLNSGKGYEGSGIYDWAFDETEKQSLTSVTFKNDKSTGNKDDSVDLTAPITIPSKEDVKSNYFTTDNERKKLATDYAELNGAQVNATGQAYWWTRSRYNGNSNPFRIGHGGGFDYNANAYFSSAGTLPQIFIAK